MDIFPNYVKATVTLSCEDFSLAVFQTRVINRQSNYIVLATPKLRAKVNTNSFILLDCSNNSTPTNNKDLSFSVLLCNKQ